MVVQLAGVFCVGSSNPGGVNTARCRRQQSAGQYLNRRPNTSRRLRYHSTGGGVIEIGFPTAWSLLSENF